MKFVCPHCKNPPSVEKRNDGIILITCTTCGIQSDVAWDIRTAQREFTKMAMLVPALNDLKKELNRIFSHNKQQ